MNGQHQKLNNYIDGWSEMMVDIWQDKIRQLKIRDTGALFLSVAEKGISHTGVASSVTHAFLEYGIYVDAGVGNGYKHGNGGDLGFTPQRERRPWQSKKYFASFMNLRDAVAEIYGEEYMNTIKMELSL